MSSLARFLPEVSLVAILDADKCTACRACVDACPFGAIFVGPKGEILKCDLCGGNPLCVKYCYPRPEAISLIFRLQKKHAFSIEKFSRK
jgi:Fe-S-cluster-containing hydrogenase component 2